jgi:membrane-bound serine protease (ClpP class)
MRSVPSRLPPSPARALGLLGLLGVLGALLALGVGSPAAAQAGRPVIEVLELHGVLDASQLGTLRATLDGADRRQVDVVLLQVDGFGGLGVDPAEVLETVRGARVPVAVWVGPRAARAQGATALVVAGADVVAVSRDATIGPALPATLGRGRGADRDEATVAAGGLPAGAVRGRLGGPAARSAGLAGYEAESLPDAVQRLDGRRVRAGAGPAGTGAAGVRTLSVGDSYRLTFRSTSLVDRVRHGLANPTLAYLLLLAAACCLAFEWFQPGFGVAGVAGLVVALLAGYALAVLPTSWPALAALLAGLALFTVDTALGGLGLGTLSAAVLTLIGSWWLFSSPSPLLRVDGRLAVLGVLWCLVYWVVVLTVGLRARRRAPEGTEALVGSRGVVRSMLNPGGIVIIEGAMWRASLTGEGMLPTGQRVRVDAVRDGILQVLPEDPEALRPARRGRMRRAWQRRPDITGPSGDGAPRSPAGHGGPAADSGPDAPSAAEGGRPPGDGQAGAQRDAHAAEVD